MALKSGRINWDQYNTSGVPSSGPKEPIKDDIRAWAKFVESFGFKSRAEFIAADIHSDFSSIMITGYYEEGDGGEQQYLKLDAMPSPVEPWHVQLSSDGSWWEPNIAEPYLEHFGAKPNSVSPGFDCYTAITNALAYAGVGGKVRGRSTTYCFGTTVVQNNEGAAFEGDVSAQYVFGAEFTQGCILKWIGATDGVMWVMGDLTAATSVSGPMLDKVTLWGNNLAKNILINRNTDNLGIGDVKLSYPNPANSAAFAYYCDSASASTGGFSGCNYKSYVKRLTMHVHGVANGARFTGKSAASGSNTTFFNAITMHCVFQNGCAYEFLKTDSFSIGQLTGSRSGGNADGSANAGSPAVGDFLRKGGSGDTTFYNVGNRIHFMHCGKTDGADPIIRLRDIRVICNDLGMLSGTDNGFQIVLENGALEPCYHNTGTGYGSTLASLAAFEVADPHKIRGYETTNKDIINVYDNIQKTNFTPVLKINGSSSGVTQTMVGRWQRIGNRVTIWVKFTLTAKSGTGNVTIDWALGAGAPPAADAVCETFSSVRPITGFTSGVVDRPLGVAMVTNTLSLLKQVAGGGGMSNLTDADISATASGIMQIDYYCATAA